MVVVGVKNIKELTWVVVSAKGDKTISVEVERVKEDAKYGKRFTVKKKYYAHDEDNSAKEWNVVRIRETRPLSKTKRWKLMEIVKETVK